MNVNDPKVIVALDYSEKNQTLDLVNKLDPALCRLKIGKELFTSCGPDIVRRVQDLGFEVFLDLKFHDIPITVAKACRAAANLGVWMINVHALGGANMMRSAKAAIEDSGNISLLTAVTILTSHSQKDIEDVGIFTPIFQEVLKLAMLAQESNLDGVVCSAQESQQLAGSLMENFLYVTPGIRPEGSNQDDQVRIMTPQQALNSGASYLVIGRPITAASSPTEALMKIVNSIQN